MLDCCQEVCEKSTSQKNCTFLTTLFLLKFETPKERESEKKREHKQVREAERERERVIKICQKRKEYY